MVKLKIKKEAGDYVHVVLFLDNSTLEIPEELLMCLADSNLAYDFFMTLTESNQRYYVDWILESKSVDTKVARIVKAIQRLEQRQKFYDWSA